MSASAPSNSRSGGGKRRPEEMKFIFVGPFHPLNDDRVGRTRGEIFTLTQPEGGRSHIATGEGRYSCSTENYTIGAAIGYAKAQLIEEKFGRERGSAPTRRKRTRSRKPAQA
jgi:hypothetical protein